MDTFPCALCGGIFAIARKKVRGGHSFCERCEKDAIAANIMGENDRAVETFNALPMVKRNAGLVGIHALAIASDVSVNLKPFLDTDLVNNSIATFLRDIGVQPVESSEFCFFTRILSVVVPAGLLNSATYTATIVMEVRTNAARTIPSSVGPLGIQQKVGLWDHTVTTYLDGVNTTSRKRLGGLITAGLIDFANTMDSSKKAWQQLIDAKGSSRRNP